LVDKGDIPGEASKKGLQVYVSITAICFTQRRLPPRISKNRTS